MQDSISRVTAEIHPLKEIQGLFSADKIPVPRQHLVIRTKEIPGDGAVVLIRRRRNSS